jgi:agmatinase
LLDADVAIIGCPFTTPVDLAQSRAPSSEAPDKLRSASLRLAGVLDGYDFDFAGDPFAGRRLSIVDCGDVWAQPGSYAENSRTATRAIELILAAGALPLILGGDHAATNPALRALSGRGGVCVVHFGAGLDWRQEVNDVPDGPDSAMRRASELAWVTSMTQIGLRGAGSSRQADVEAAAAFGSIQVRAEDVHDLGVAEVLARVPRADSYFISLGMDSLDPGIAPGVALPRFGGLTYFEATNLLRGIAARGPVIGASLVGIVPANDLNDMTSLLGVRLLLNLIGALAHERRLGPETRAAVGCIARVEV